MAMEIKIIKNKEIKINEVKMNCDAKIKNLEPPLQSYGFFYSIIGPPASGKTNLLLNMITTKGKCIIKNLIV